MGKTHLIKRFIDTVEGQKPLLVSLFGVARVDEIEAAIFAASLPLLDSKYAKAAGRFTKTLLRFAPQQFANLGPEDFLTLKLPPVLIFDDLERTNLGGYSGYRRGLGANAGKTFLSTHRNEVVSIFNAAGYNNLRSLAQVLWDFGRFYRALTPLLQEKTKGGVSLLKVFVALGLTNACSALSPESRAVKRP